MEYTSNVELVAERARALINYIWIFLIVVGFGVGIATGRLEDVTNAALDSATSAAQLSLSLIGIYALWLGLLNIANESGLIEKIASKMQRVIHFLFREIPKKSKAIGYITLNMVANMLGMGNAATPFGLKAMEELQQINPNKKVATNAMCMLLVINTSSIQLLPLTIVGIRAAAGSANPSEIILTSLIATTVTTLVGIIACKIFEKRRKGL